MDRSLRRRYTARVAYDTSSALRNVLGNSFRQGVSGHGAARRDDYSLSTEWPEGDAVIVRIVGGLLWQGQREERAADWREERQSVDGCSGHLFRGFWLEVLIHRDGAKKNVG